jgi:hypothetical protein
MSDAQNTPALATAHEDLKSARGLVWDAAYALHFDARQFARLVQLSNELESEIEYLGRHLPQPGESFLSVHAPL